MNTSGEAADQVLRMTLEGTEAALKITGKGAEKITVLLYKMLKDLAKESNKTQGQMRLANMIKSGKKLEIFEIPDANLKKFCEMAKTYGVVYTVLKDKNQDDGKCEIMVKADDSQKINHILRRMEIVVENTGTVETDADKVKEEYYKEHPEKARTEEGGEPGEPERASMEKSEEDKFLDELMSKPNPTREEAQMQNPTEARTTKSGPSVPSSESKGGSPVATSSERDAGGERRPSVRAELKQYREEINKAEEAKPKTAEKSPAHEHKAPKKKKAKERE